MSTNYSSNQFGTVDYFIFMVLLLLNAGVGLFYVVKDKRNKTENAQEYLLGGRKQGFFPVGLSLSVTFLSSSTILGAPVEIYYFNSMYMMIGLAFILAAFLAATVFIPFFYRLGVTSTFQYLELRFNRGAKLCGVVALIIQMMLYMAIVLYGPSLALSAVTGWNLESCITGIGIFVTLYTTMGGMKTVLWTDSLQTVIILTGIFAVFIKGCMAVGGLTTAWKIAGDRDRVQLDQFSFEPSVRHSFWSVVIGGGVFWTAMFGTSQAQVQRCLATASIATAQRAILLAVPFVLILVTISSLNGILMFAYYSDCDPVKVGRIQKKDQLLPLFFLDILGHVNGLSGLFLASVCAASLSTISSGVNAISAILYEEIIKIRRLPNRFKNQNSGMFTKLISFAAGVAVIGLCFAIQNIDMLQESTMLILGVVNGPVFYLFVAGIFFPWINSWGAITGFISSITFAGWVSIGAKVHKVRTAMPMQTITIGCPLLNHTMTTSITMTSMETMTTDIVNSTTATLMEDESGYQGVEVLYTLSYLYLTLAGLLVGISVGLFVSYITGFTKPSQLDRNLVLSMFYLLSDPKETNKFKNVNDAGLLTNNENDESNTTEQKDDIMKYGQGRQQIDSNLALLYST